MSSPARPIAPLRTVFQPVTVRVAWELLRHGVRVSPTTLRDCREHVLACLPAGVGDDEAERLAGPLTADFLVRVREKRFVRVELDDDVDIDVPREWRRRLLSAVDHLGDAVLRLHYGDGMSLVEVERHAAVGKASVVAAREGLRAGLRSVASADEPGIQALAPGRIDQLLRRVASVAERGCPGPMGLLTDEGRVHADACPRCSRAVRLIRGGVIAPTDLFLPDGQDALTGAPMGLAVLLLHPDARQRHQRALEQAIGDRGVPVTRGGWLLAEDDLRALGPQLMELARLGTPPRHHLRSATVRGRGRWVRGVPLGPLPLQALDAARSRPWAELQGLPVLPPPLPPPPRATRWWVSAAVAGVLAAAAGAWAMWPRTADPTFPVDASLAPTAEGWSVRFDADDRAVIDIVTETDGELRVFAAGTPTSKGQWGTGEGDYLLQVDADHVALLSSGTGVGDLADRVELASQQPQPLRALLDGLGAQGIDVAVVHSPLPEPPSPTPSPL